MKRENVVGRANVEDTPALEAYYGALEGEALGALWNVANEIEPWYPQPKSVPMLWKWMKVEDTPALEAYYGALEGEALGALWNVANEIEPWYPQPKSVPMLWKWKKV